MRSAAPVRRLALVLAVLVAAAAFVVGAVALTPSATSTAPSSGPAPASNDSSAVELHAGNVVPAIVRANVEASLGGVIDPSRRSLRVVPTAAMLAALVALAMSGRRRASLASRVRTPQIAGTAGTPPRAPPLFLSTPA